MNDSCQKIFVALYEAGYKILRTNEEYKHPFGSILLSSEWRDQRPTNVGYQ